MKYRKKPIVVEAFQWPPTGLEAIRAMVDMVDGSEGAIKNGEDGTLEIRTPEGVMIAIPGDWVIRGVEGEYYPCKPDIFAKTYEPA